ncbi:MAG TPA: DUF2914 domain-containing protein [Candidatus Paceibacterota bacterium]|nr:DUF2914 domain-containing protein [Candidatus Paceibacterota bacterium]
MKLIKKAQNWYKRFERPVSSLSLIGGFVFDAITLKRVDTFWENLWIFGHILIVGLFIILIHVKEVKPNDAKDPSKAHFWYVNILQFFFGGLLSTYLVFYFRSADIFVTWPFVLLLALAFIANESLKRQYIRLSFQISLFFLSVYSFAIFLVPVVLHKIGTKIFLLSGLLSLIFIFFFVLILFYFKKDRSKLKKSKRMTFLLVSGMFLVINFLYFTNLIPPIPLSLKDADVYHSIHKNSSGNYDVTYEDQDWKSYFKLYREYRKTPNAPVYVYSAIFSPKDLNLTILHEWQYYSETEKKWITDVTVRLPVIGGRDGGFRTYSMRTNLNYGKWRVNIKTELGQTIGHLLFKVLPTETEPILLSDVKK